MTDLHATGEDRKMIFANVANGVPMDQVRTTFKRSQTEIDRELRFVARKIKEYRFRRRLPPLDCDDVRSIRFNRRPLLETLDKLGSVYLSSELILPEIGVQKIDGPGIIQDVQRQLRAAGRA